MATSTADMKYAYKALNDDRSIRILSLAAGKQDEPLIGTLDVVDIDQAGSYEPISYVWAEPGPPNCSYAIHIRDSHADEDRLLDLRGGSLFAAFRRLRLLERERRLWADQVCIDQDNMAERSQQVQFMDKIYKGASRVLVWMGMDDKNEAELAFQLVDRIHTQLSNEIDREAFHTRFTRDLDDQSPQEWEPLEDLTNRSWFNRGWIVQEIGTSAAATLFWGESEIDWLKLYRVCEELAPYHRLRKKFNINTSKMKYFFQRYVEPDRSSYHANRFEFLYELHRARTLSMSDQRDRVFAFLGHYAVRSTSSGPNSPLLTIHADYTQSVEWVYTDLARRALLGSKVDSALLALATVQHESLPSRLQLKDTAIGTRDLPSWVPDWRIYQGFILSEPINPYRAHGNSAPRLSIDQDILSIHGIEVDTISVCSQPLLTKEFYANKTSADTVLRIEHLWHDICKLGGFNLNDKYAADSEQQAFYAFMQTLSNGCVQIATRVSETYSEIPISKWLEQAAIYLVKHLGDLGSISPDIRGIAEQAELAHEKEQWSRSANGASRNRCYARTHKGYYVLGPKVLEEGDIVCVLFGGKMPFCLRPWGDRFLLVGECYVHGLLAGEAMDMMGRGELHERCFEIV